MDEEAPFECSQTFVSSVMGGGNRRVEGSEVLPPY